MPSSFQHEFTGPKTFPGVVYGIRNWRLVVSFHPPSKTVHFSPDQLGSLLSDSTIVRNSSFFLIGGWSKVWTSDEMEALCEPPSYVRSHLTCCCLDVSRLCWFCQDRLDYGFAGKHRAADPACQCGFYAYFEDAYRNKKTSWPEGNGVAGVVAGYGNSTIGTSGFRSEKAKILALVPIITNRGERTEFAGELYRRKLQIDYPEIPVFDSIDVMLREFPTSKAEEFL